MWHKNSVPNEVCPSCAKTTEIYARLTEKDVQSVPLTGSPEVNNLETRFGCSRDELKLRTWKWKYYNIKDLVASINTDLIYHKNWTKNLFSKKDIHDWNASWIYKFPVHVKGLKHEWGGSKAGKDPLKSSFDIK